MMMRENVKLPLCGILDELYRLRRSLDRQLDICEYTTHLLFCCDSSTVFK